MHKLTLGCDPEVFIQIPKKRQRFVSAHDLVPGSKTEPFKLKKGAVQADGTAAEFNIDPCATVDEWIGNLKEVQDQILNGIRAKHPTAEFDWSPIRTYSPKYWEEKVPKYAKELGCDPDFNAYTGRENPRPDVTAIGSMRSAGGHIHFGWTSGVDPLDPTHFKDCCILTKALDTFLFPFSPSWDDDRKRMSIYGKPGAFRPKPYGMEYRVLSNAWVKSERTQRFVYTLSNMVFQWLTVERAARFVYSTSPQPTYFFNELFEGPLGNPFPKEKSNDSMVIKYHRDIFKELGV